MVDVMPQVANDEARDVCNPETISLLKFLLSTFKFTSIFLNAGIFED
jgi:hypothetical protein